MMIELWVFFCQRKIISSIPSFSLYEPEKRGEVAAHINTVMLVTDSVGFITSTHRR